MKKFTVCGAAVALCCLAGNVQAQEPEYPASASTEVFDFTPWNDDKLLLLFAQAADEGRKYPTKEEFEAAGFNLDLEFSRSHVRPAVIMEDAAKNIVADVYPTRRLWMNTPTRTKVKVSVAIPAPNSIAMYSLCGTIRIYMVLGTTLYYKLRVLGPMPLTRMGRTCSRVLSFSSLGEQLQVSISSLLQRKTRKENTCM